MLKGCSADNHFGWPRKIRKYTSSRVRKTATIAIVWACMGLSPDCVLPNYTPCAPRTLRAKEAQAAGEKLEPNCEHKNGSSIYAMGTSPSIKYSLYRRPDGEYEVEFESKQKEFPGKTVLLAV